MFLFPLRCQFIWHSFWFCSLKSVRCASGLLWLWVPQCRLKPTRTMRTMLEVRRLDSWTNGETRDQTLNTDCPQDTSVFCRKKTSWIRSFVEHNDVLLTYWDTGSSMQLGWKKTSPLWRWAMWPCGLLREADKLPNGYRGDQLKA